VFVDNIEIIIHYKVIFTMMLCQESGAEFLSILADFVNLGIDGRCPADVAPVFFGGRLLALNKKTGHSPNCCWFNTKAFGFQVCQFFQR